MLHAQELLQACFDLVWMAEVDKPHGQEVVPRVPGHSAERIIDPHKASVGQAGLGGSHGIELEEGTIALLARAQRLFRLLALGDVRRHADNATDASPLASADDAVRGVPPHFTVVTNDAAVELRSVGCPRDESGPLSQHPLSVVRM